MQKVLYQNQNSPESLHKQYYTFPKERIMKTMAGHTNILLSDGYRDTSGENSDLLLGTRGIGKSKTLLSCCIALSTMNKKLIPIYLQYNYNNENMLP